MSFYATRMCCLGALTLAAVTSLAAVPGNALTLKECSAKYRAAQSGGTTGGLSWQDFRKANCGVSAYAPAGTTAAFPKAISAKYAKEPAGKARMHTCLDQYHANKATNGNGGLRWIAKGGGYYSECNKRLKG